MRFNVKRDLSVLDRFQKLMAKEDNLSEIWEELDKLVPEEYRQYLIVNKNGAKYIPGCLFTWLVMNGIIVDPREMLKQLKCSIEIEDGELGLAGPGPVPFFQPFLIQ
jgi:hypothetical protein